MGLNPNNPVDAQEDFDRDGLTNLQEYQLGTGIRNPDSDGDGLLDGDEVNIYQTNPLLADTDGDKRRPNDNCEHSEAPWNRTCPERIQQTTWKEFLKRYWDQIIATDFFTVEVWTLSLIST